MICVSGRYCQSRMISARLEASTNVLRSTLSGRNAVSRFLKAGRAMTECCIPNNAIKPRLMRAAAPVPGGNAVRQADDASHFLLLPVIANDYTSCSKRSHVGASAVALCDPHSAPSPGPDAVRMSALRFPQLLLPTPVEHQESVQHGVSASSDEYRPRWPAWACGVRIPVL